MVRDEASKPMTIRRAPKLERRRHPRAITNFSATVTVGRRSYSARVINLSMGGALLDLGRVPPEPSLTAGDLLSLDIRCRGGVGPLHLEARAVMWNTTAGDVPLLAVQFDEITEDNDETLEDLMFEALSELRGRVMETRH